ncbi:MAG: methylenetetrahydrofolate reductase, partial [Gemmatimonadales bacterium]
MTTGNPSTMSGRPPSIGELIREQGPTFSFEFFPPKTPDGERLLWQAIRELEVL